MRAVLGVVSGTCQRIEVEALDEAPRLLLIQVSEWKEHVTGAAVAAELTSESCPNSVAGAVRLACGGQATR